MKKILILANLLIALVVAGLIAAQALSDREQVINAAYDGLGNVTTALSSHTQQTLATIDLGLRTIIEEYSQMEARGDSYDAATLFPILLNRQIGSTSTYSFYVIDENGQLLATSRTPNPLPLDSSDVADYVGFRDGTIAGLYIGAPRRGRVGLAQGNWVMSVSRRLNKSDGSFGGLVAASLSEAYLMEFYDALRLSGRGSLGLLSRDGIVMVRSPFNEDLMGADVSGSSQFQGVTQAQTGDGISDLFLDDEVGRVSAYRFIRDGQLIVYADNLQSDVLVDWRSRLWIKIGLGVLLFLLFLTVSTATALYIVRRQAWEEENFRRLRLLAESSASLAEAPDIDTLITRVRELAALLSGAGSVVVALERSDGVSQSLTPTRVVVPICSKAGPNVGSIQLSDKDKGIFTANDLYEMRQLASLTGVVIDNLEAVAAREEALVQTLEAKQEIETVLTSISDAVFWLDTDWCFVYMNAQAERLLDRSAKDLLHRSIWEEFPDSLGSDFEVEYKRARNESVPVYFEQFFQPMQAWFSVRAFPHEQGLTVYFQDTTARVETEQRLRQSQKMDAIGQLTGGVAHDFNNLLTVILGNADAMEEYLADAPEWVRQQAGIIRKAGERAAELTHRLLAFARRQPLDPRRTNINKLLGDVEEMLRRILGESISIELVRGSGLWQAIVDPGELQNAILNLAINARDAMPGGGKLTIETANTAVDRDYADTHQIQPGQYVLIAVSDTGEGMQAHVVTRAFEPFFTTKAEGKGSGLGLSMVYGFARQTGGHVKIYSEQNEGTTIKLYLPRAVDTIEAEYQRSQTIAPLLRGLETILLVEDDDMVRQHTVDSLRRLGYSVTECSHGREALAHLEQGRQFDMLLTDVVLAGGISGKQVAIEAVRLAPALRVLYMSGYTENAIVHHGRLDRGVALLSKPFRLSDLARKVREVLDGSA